MQRLGRFLGTMTVVPLLVVTGASPERGGDRRINALVLTLQILLLVALAVGWIPFLPVVTVLMWLAVAVVGSIGALLLVLALAAFVQMALLLLRGRRTMATAVADTDPSGRPQFEFVDDAGRTQVVDGPVASLGTGFCAGQQVPLIYLPGRPDRFVLDRFGDKWGAGLLLLVVGMIPLLVAVAFAVGIEQFAGRGGRVVAAMMSLAVGLFCSGMGAALAARAFRFRHRAAQATGVVVEVKTTHDSRSVVVGYEDAGEVARQGTVELPSGSRYEVGEEVPILYDPEQPWQVRLDTAWSWYASLITSALLILFGQVFLVATLFVWGVLPLR